MGRYLRSWYIFVWVLALAGFFPEQFTRAQSFGERGDLESQAPTPQGLDAIFEVLLQRSYRRAIEDARDATDAEIDDELWAIDPENPDLIWLGPQQSQVLMTTWTNWDGYDALVGSPFDLDRPIWVTPAPQVQRFCQDLNYEAASLTLRLEQYLGLPPHNGKTKFVEFWVAPEDLFRPCPDPEISDRSCLRQFPEEADIKHRRWIVELILSSYGANGYPWTRLGYTYDWGNAQTEVGASEFVIESGARVTIRSVKTTEEFCRVAPKS